MKKSSGNQLTIESLFKEVNGKPKGPFDYSSKIVTPNNKKNSNILNNINKTTPHLAQTTMEDVLSKKQIPYKKNKRISAFKDVLKKKRKGEELTDYLLNLKSKENFIQKKEKKENEEQKKTLKKTSKSSEPIWINTFAKELGVSPEEIERRYKEDEKKRKAAEEQKQLNYNLLLERSLMGNKQRKFETQKEEEEERLKKEKEIKDSLYSYDLNMSIPYINQARQNNLYKYNKFRPNINDIYKNVLDFNFYYKERQTEEVPNTFENEAHYKYIWITDFFNELKYCLLNEKIEKSEIQNYEEADIKLDLISGDSGENRDEKLILMKINPNKKLYELKKRILKDNDIIALYDEKYNFDKSQITLKNEKSLNYFLGIITRDYDSND